MGTCVMTTASDVSDSNGGENIWKEQAAASRLCETAESKVNFAGFFKIDARWCMIVCCGRARSFAWLPGHSIER